MFRNALLSITIAMLACAALPAAASDAAHPKIGYSVSDKDGKALFIVDGAGKVIVPTGADIQDTALKIAAIMNAKGLCGVHTADFVINDKAGKPMFTVAANGKLAVSKGVHTNREAREVVAKINAESLCSPDSVVAADTGGTVTIHGFGKAKAR